MKAFNSSSAGSTSSSMSPRSTPSPEPNSKYGVGSVSGAMGGLNLNMSAKEMRERIGSRKKRDPRRDDRMDFRQKFDIIDSL